MTLTQITEKGIKDGEIVNADINASAAIAKSKLASLEIVNADINASAAIAKSKLASLDIVNADINASAAIAKSKLASLDIVNADINASASIAGTKIATNFGSQNIVTTGNISAQAITTNGNITVSNTYPCFNLTDTNNDSDWQLRNNNGQFAIQDLTNSTQRFCIGGGGRIGINQASPDANLHLTGDTPKFRIESTNGLHASAGTEEIGRIEFEGTKGSNNNVAASMRVRQDGTWSTSDDFFSPTAIEFYTQDQSGTEITTPRLTIDSNGHLKHPDDKMAKFGDDDDFEIFHQSSNGNSIIRETGGGILSLQTNGSAINCYNSTGGVAMATFTTGGSCAFKHGSDLRFETLSDGAAVTGSLGIGTTSPADQLHIRANSNVGIRLDDSGQSYGNIIYNNGQSSTDALTIAVDEGNTQASSTMRFRVDASEKMRIDSSGRLLLGRTSGSFPLDVNGAARISDIFYMDNDKRIQWGGSDVAYIEGNDNEKLVFGIGSERARIDNNGHLVITDGNLEVASGHGIDFSNNTSASGVSSNLFDDYEEGTWTPTLNKAGATGSADSQVNIRAGYYVKSGDLLWISFYWYSGNLSFGTGTNAWYIGGLPFNLLTNQNSAYQFIPGGYLYQNSHTGVSHQAGYRWQSNNTNGAATITMYGQGNTTNAGGGAWEFSGCGCLRVS